MASGGHGDEPSRRSLWGRYRQKKLASRPRRLEPEFDEPEEVVPESPPAPPQAEEPEPEPERRIYIEPDGDSFNPSRQPVHKIRDIIRSRFDSPWVRYSDVPVDVKAMWFREFSMDFYWDPANNAAISSIFHKRLGTRFRDMFTDIRKVNKCPPWIAENVWDGLQRAWNTPEYLAKREKAKANRGSDAGGLGTSLHTGGSIPYTEHRRRLAKSLGRDPDLSELYAHTHQHQIDHTWVDNRAHVVGDTFNVNYTAMTQPSLEGESPVLPTQDAVFESWKKAAGGKKKGRIYGLGAATKIFERGSSSQHTAQPRADMVSRREFEEMQAQLKEEHRRLASDLAADIEQRFEERFRAMEQARRKKKSHRGKGKQVNEDSEDTPSE